MPTNPSATHQANSAGLLAGRFERTRALSVELCAPLEPEDYVLQSMPDASPAKWHLAHTTWFFETFLLGAKLPGYHPFHPSFGYLFNSYYNTIGDRIPRARRGLLSRPTVAQVIEYRRHVDRAMLDLLGGPEHDGVFELIELGLNHEQQHQELIVTDVKHGLAQNPIRPAYDLGLLRDAGPKTIPPLTWHEYDERIQTIGFDGSGFSFDNEQPRHRQLVGSFLLASRPTTNAEYLEFVADGGYERPEFWLSDGWAARTAQGWSTPLYWEPRAGGSFATFTLAGMEKLVPGEPVAHVSYYEADAFARWSQARLPTEAEWESVAVDTPLVGRFLEANRLHPRPAATGDAGPLQLFGDLWEWTSSPYSPYPGFSAAPGAVGEYNGKFMCNQFVLRGGSCATPEGHVRATYRNFFPPDARWQFSGIRLARDPGSPNR